jgi:hypothetical protein
MHTLTAIRFGILASFLFTTAPVLADDLKVGRYHEDCSNEDSTWVTVLPAANGVKRASMSLDDNDSKPVNLNASTCDGQPCYSGKAMIDLRFSDSEGIWGTIRSCYGDYLNIDFSNLQQFGNDTIYLKVTKPYSITTPGCYITWEHAEYVLNKCG